MAVVIPLPGGADASDETLVRRVREGDRRAFEQLMRRHNRRLFRTARAILKDDSEAEDALQDGYLQAFRSLSAFRGDSQLATWLTRIVANQALMRLRKHARRAAIVPIHLDDEASPTDRDDKEAPAMDQPDNTAMRHEMRRLLEKRIDALPDSYRVVFVLRAVEELSVEETAASLGIPESTVRTRFFRARSRLRESLATEIDRACDDAFGFAGDRCDRIVANVLARLAGTNGDSP